MDVDPTEGDVVGAESFNGPTSVGSVPLRGQQEVAWIQFLLRNSLMLGQQREDVCERTPEFHNKSSMRFCPLHLAGMFWLTIPWRLLLTSRKALLLMTHILQVDPRVHLQLADQ
jgi:hypothetical protein